ncbi:MAG: hypothetical protein WDZ79_01200 [Candidatus Paceibacterota bacterium]
MSHATISSVEVTTTTNKSGSSTLSTTVHTAGGSETYNAATAYGTAVTGEQIRKLQEKVSNSLVGIDAAHQQEVDDILAQVSDTSTDTFDTNAVLSSISLANAKTASAVIGVPLHEHIRGFANTNGGSPVPLLYTTLISGGPRNPSPLAFRAFNIIPETDNIERAYKVVRDIKTALGTVLRTNTHEEDLPTGHDGAFSPLSLEFNQAGLEMLLEGVAEAFPEVKVRLAINAGASQLFSKDTYRIDQQKLTAQQLQGYYDYLIDRFHISSIEDPFDRDAFGTFREMRERHESLQVVGGELVKTNIERLHRAHEEKSVSAISVTPSDSRTLSEMLTVIRAAHEASIRCIISHGDNETPESLIADLAVGCGCFGIKPGAPGTQENDVKYERLMEIA